MGRLKLIYVFWFQPEYSNLLEHTYGPDTRSFPVGLTGKKEGTWIQKWWKNCL